ncbi:uncharacterized protein [Physcomitrium patens]|uniref:Uncharacterized protein n=1 Tax=Physcomitrium patens TaxID=3218 RepID=A0A2K1JLR3_PHYPA|nr:uncharacterized protein LOC112290729 [Physcomitrium patens]PNR42459.1 hypothetical protein PHYPA_017289 [Physcomitrium patens]|eukprot:XP_024393122.1 uncharacterized protein LOC112290729 [Physcomitrella patens]
MAASLLDWLRAWFDPKDLVESRELVKKLNLPESTSQFVMALRPKDSPESVVYLLSSWYFSEKAVRDVRELIAKAQPKAVVALVDLESIDSFREEERLAAKDGVPVEVPTSSFDVVRENFERDPIVPYDSRARVRLANSIFGTGAYGDVLEAKEAAAKVNALFRYIDYPYRSSAHPQPPAEGESSTPAETPSTSPDPVQDSSRQNLLANDNRVLDALNSEVTRRVTEGLRRMVTESPLAELHQWRKSTSQALAQMFGHNTSLSDTKPTTESTEPSKETSEEASDHPKLALPFLPIFEAFHGLFRMRENIDAASHALNVCQAVERGQEVSSNDLRKASMFRIFVEICRVRMNNSILASARKVPSRSAAEFYDLPYEDKSHAILAQSLQKEAREHGTVVAVVDVNRVAGIRQQWNQQIPEDFIPLIDECYVSTDEVKEVDFLETLFSFGEKTSHHSEASQEKKAAVVVGAGAAAAVGLAYLPHWAGPLSPLVKFVLAKSTTLFKIGFLNSKRSLALTVAKGMPGASKIVLPVKASAAKVTSVSAGKAALTAEKAQVASQGLVSGLQRQFLQAIRTNFYNAMRERQKKKFSRGAWVIFGSSMMAGAGILWYGDSIERGLGAVWGASDAAQIGRGLQSLSEAEKKTKHNWDAVYNEVYRSENSVSARLKKKFGYGP